MCKGESLTERSKSMKHKVIINVTNDNPKIAVEVLIGHGVCHVIIETT